MGGRLAALILFSGFSRFFVRGLLSSKLLAELLTSMRGKELVEPTDFGSLVFASENFDDVALFEFGVEVGDLAIDFDAGGFGADFGMKAKSEI